MATKNKKAKETIYVCLNDGSSGTCGSWAGMDGTFVLIQKVPDEKLSQKTWSSMFEDGADIGPLQDDIQEKRVDGAIIEISELLKLRDLAKNLTDLNSLSGSYSEPDARYIFEIIEKITRLDLGI